MSNLWLNIRFFLWHVKAEKGCKWWKIFLSKNDFHIGNPKKFEVYILRNPFEREGS